MNSPQYIRALLRFALAAILAAVVTHTRADPDLYGHVRFGHDIVSAHTVRLADTYSFTSDRSWVNHEWLSEVVMYAAFAAGGTRGLVVLKLALLAAMLAAVVVLLQSLGVPPSSRDLLVALVVVGTFPQTNHVRPQLFSLALFAWLLVLLIDAPRRPARLWWILPLMTVWVNAHGGWIVGAGTIGIWTAATIAGGRRQLPPMRLIALAAAAVAASLLNPYGWGMWSFLRDTVGFGRADIVDWQPVFVVGPAYGLLWVLTASVATTAIWKAVRKSEADARAIALVVLLAVAAFRVNRLLSFFTIATVMTLGRWTELPARRSAEPVRAPSRLAAGVAAAVALAIAAGATTLAAANAACIRMEPAMFPEPEVRRVVAAEGIRGRMLTWFDWGEYAIWYFSPSIAVSMDGRRETVYSEETIRRQLDFYRRPDMRQALLEQLNPDAIWVPSGLEVTTSLVADGWKPIFAGPRSTLLVRGASPLTASASPAGPGASAPRCFPGP